MPVEVTTRAPPEVQLLLMGVCTLRLSVEGMEEIRETTASVRRWRFSDLVSGFLVQENLYQVRPARSVWSAAVPRGDLDLRRTALPPDLIPDVNLTFRGRVRSTPRPCCACFAGRAPFRRRAGALLAGRRGLVGTPR